MRTETANCEGCGKPFERQVRTQPRRFCEPKCYNREYYRSTDMRGLGAPQPCDAPLSETANLWLRRPPRQDLGEVHA
jgi:hypothetical protein